MRAAISLLTIIAFLQENSVFIHSVNVTHRRIFAYGRSVAGIEKPRIIRAGHKI